MHFRPTNTALKQKKNRWFCKQALFVLKRSLVCTEKKPCLQSKEALFAMQTRLLCKWGMLWMVWITALKVWKTGTFLLINT